MIYLVNKPPGMTSFDVIRALRKKTGVWKMGHAGTLDPAASGLLIVGTESDTKKLSGFLQYEKEYIAEIEFGKISDTYDRDGSVEIFSGTLEKFHHKKIEEKFSCGKIEMELEQFRGEIFQTPPKFSAKKINGIPAYKLARQGKAVSLKPKKVTVSEYEILGFEWPFLRCRIVCSSGTYVRSLAHDLGQKLGCGAYLKSLVRTRVGEFRLENAVPI